MVLVVATAGEAGLAEARAGCAGRLGRPPSCARSAAALGCARVIGLDYPDSGMRKRRAPRLRRVADDGARRAGWREVLREERADALTVYDPRGGYGHPDHLQVHRVGSAGRGAGRHPGGAAGHRRPGPAPRCCGRCAWLPAAARRTSPPTGCARPTPLGRADPPGRRAPVHRREARRDGRPRQPGGRRRPDRTLALCLRLPRALYRPAFGPNGSSSPAGRPARPLLDDMFATLRG